MSLPNFICLGAAKSGTTTLCDILRQHPEIYIPSFKEPHFFDIPENYKNGIDWYKKNYYRNALAKVIADFTPSYFFDKEAPKRIFESLGGKVKFVVILRNPVDRAYSHYLHSKRDDHEDLEFKEAIQHESSRLKQYEESGDYLSYLRQSYVSQGLYYDMLARYLEYFSLDNFLFIQFEEEFIKHREETIIKILNFLEIKNFNLKTDIKSNPASKEKSKTLKRIMKKTGWWRKILKFLVPSIQLRQIIRNKIQRANIIEIKAGKLSDDLKKEIYRNYFSEQIDSFSKISNKKISW
ncbi:MAG: hypothetical protein CMD22_03260 [Flavobacteriales bacterium]|nr:hypothetical protein [Flavobacteriales bacterium]